MSSQIPLLIGQYSSMKMNKDTNCFFNNENEHASIHTPIKGIYRDINKNKIENDFKNVFNDSKYKVNYSNGVFNSKSQNSIRNKSSFRKRK